MDHQSGWIIVLFNNDNSVEAVPDIWLKKNTCAWPKSKQIKKYIDRRIKPNNNEFSFFNARKLGNKVYSSLAEAKSKLPKATLKSDISSSTEDEYYSRLTKKRHISLSPHINNLKKINNSNKSNSSVNNSCPPRYIPKGSNCIKISEKSVTSDSNSNHDDDDSDNDPTWKVKRKTDFDNHQVDNDNIQSTPLKKLKESDWVLSSPSGKWTVTPIDLEKLEVNKSISTNASQEKVISNKYISSKTNLNISSNVKRQLIFKENSVENSGLGVDNKFTTQSTIENIVTSLKDFQRVFLTSHAFIKHEIQCLTFLCHTTNDNIEKLLKEKITSYTQASDDHVNMDVLFPIKNEDELQAFENKLKDVEFKTSLVGKVALLIGNKDLGNSVRRIMARMFYDQLLTNYSLYGFKKKKAFTSLSCYRLIIDSLRKHIKYKHNTEKEIDIPLGNWLSHAPFRIKSKKQSAEEEEHGVLVF